MADCGARYVYDAKWKAPSIYRPELTFDDLVCIRPHGHSEKHADVRGIEWADRPLPRERKSKSIELTAKHKKGKRIPMPSKKTPPKSKSSKGPTMSKARATTSAAEKLETSAPLESNVHNLSDHVAESKRGRLIQTRVSEEIYAAIAAQARAERRKVSPYLAIWLEEAFLNPPKE